MKKNIALLLAFLMLISCTACSDSGTASEKKQSLETTLGDSTAETEETTLFENDSLPSDMDFGGTGVSFFVRDGLPNPEFYVAELNGEIVNDAVYERNRLVEERLNIKMNFTEEPGDNAARADFVKRIQTSILAGDGAFDIVGAYSMCTATLAFSNLLLDLAQLDYLDFTKPWWPESLIGEAAFKDKLYFCSGDISTYMLYMLYAVFFNINMMNDHNLELPYEAVYDGSWTIGKMMEMSQGIYSDLNGDGAKDFSDCFGFTTHSTYTDPFFYSFGLRTVEKDSDGNPAISPLFSSAKAQEVLELICGFFYSTNDAMRYDDYNLNRDSFTEKRALFHVNEVALASSSLRDVDFEYGILPMPKYDEAQQHYYTISSFPYNLFGVPVDCTKPDTAAAVIEAMASASYRIVSPALFEVAMKVKYSNDDDTSKMYDIVRQSNMFDLGRIFNDSMNSMTYSLFRGSIVGNDTDWASKYAKNEAKLTAAFDAVLEAIG